MRILICLAPMAGHFYALWPILQQFIKQGHQVDFIIDETFQFIVNNYEGINKIIVHPTFMNEQSLENMKLITSQRNKQGIVHSDSLTFLFKMLISICQKAVPFMMNQINPQDYQLVIMDNFAIYAIPFIQKYKLKFIVSESLYISEEMIAEIRICSRPEVIAEYEQYFGVEFQQQEFMFSLDYADQVIVHSSKLMYETPLNQKYIHVLDPQIIEINENKSLNNEKSIILISLGTLFNNHLEFFNLLIEYFSKKEYQVIVTLGNNKELQEQLQKQYNFENIKIELWVDQKEILRKASLFFTHAGYNSIKEAICSNTPMITAPQDADQPYISKRLQQLGVSLELKEYSVHCLDTIFNQIKDNYGEFQQKIKILQESFKEVMTPKQFVEQYEL